MLLSLLPDGQHLEGKVVYIDEDLDIALVSLRRKFPTSRARRCPDCPPGRKRFRHRQSQRRHAVQHDQRHRQRRRKFREAGAGTWIQTDTPINPGNIGGPKSSASTL